MGRRATKIVGAACLPFVHLSIVIFNCREEQCVRILAVQRRLEPRAGPEKMFDSLPKRPAAASYQVPAFGHVRLSTEPNRSRTLVLQTCGMVFQRPYQNQSSVKCVGFGNIASQNPQGDS
jgi:hypothetical protein